MPPRRFLDRLWRRPVRGRSGGFALEPRSRLDDRGEATLRSLIADVLGRHGTMIEHAETATIADVYVALDDDGRRRVLELLAQDFWSDQAAVDAAIRGVQAAASPAARRRAEHQLREELTPPAARLFQLFTALDGGVKLLVDIRADLLRLSRDGHAELSGLDEELRAHLATLFDVGLLELRQITWDAPASLLEKLIEYEAVHAIDSWTDLKNRLDSDRRCYAFFHPAMPAEPLVFVEIALTAGMVTELAPLLDEAAPDVDPEHADTAVFYGISSCQPGLAGVNLGNALIKQVVEELGLALANIRQFVTLSPIPGFRQWLDAELAGDAITERERELLPAEPHRVLARLADDEWSTDEAVKPGLLALCARYLTTRIDGRALDQVTNFHLANGASIERVDWLADTTRNGRLQSAGMMANYLYEPERIAERAEAYATRGEIAVAGAVRELLAE